jgi:hypothetical protein
MTEAKHELPGVNVLLIGPAGTGKTHSIGTLVDAGIEVFYLALENGLESLLGYWTDSGKPIPANLHWHTVKAADTSFADMMENAKKINTLSYESVSKLVDPNRSRHNQFVEIFSVLNDFVDQRTGQKFGAVNTWDSKRALVIDGMTGLGQAAMAMVVGGKPVKSQPDWGIAQDQVEKLLRKLADGCACHFVLLAHVERETDAILGGVKLMVSTLGRALAPKIPAMFSDVVLAKREGTKWTWDTANPMADLKTRNLAIREGMEPSFGPIIAKWKARAAATQSQ